MRSASLGLHQISMPGASPRLLIETAARLGCAGACVFVHAPARPGGPAFPVVEAGDAATLGRIAREAGVAIVNAEYLPITPDTRIEDYAGVLALASALGARRTVVHLHDPEQERGLDALGRLCILARGFGLRLGLEFLGFSAGCNSLADALAMVEAVGEPDVGVGIDALHLVRSGGTPAEVAAAPAERIAYAQICDGRGRHVSADYLAEARHRLIPGTGDFPLRAFVAALPDGTDVDVEVPVVPDMTGFDPARHAARAVAAARALFDTA